MKYFIKKMLRTNKYIEILAYILQNNKLLNSSGEGEFSKNINEIYNHNIKIAKQYIDNFKGDLENKVVLEIGTGFTRAAMLYIIKESNLKKAYCYDRFNCLHGNDKKIIEKYDLAKYLDKLEYICGDNDEISKNIKAHSVNYIVSNAVLEHVNNIELLFINLSNVLSKDGYMYHRVDLRCHNRFKIHGELYFHTFNKKLWNIMGCNIGQPNRKLMFEYLNYFDRFDLKCKINIVEKFSKEELAKARIYLDKNNISNYETSIVEFNLCKR